MKKSQFNPFLGLDPFKARSSHPSPGWPGCSDATLVSLVAVSKKPGRLETMIGCLARQALSTFFTCARSRVPSRTHRTSLAPGTRANFPYPGSQVGGSFFAPARPGPMPAPGNQSVPHCIRRALAEVQATNQPLYLRVAGMPSGNILLQKNFCRKHTKENF